MGCGTLNLLTTAKTLSVTSLPSLDEVTHWSGRLTHATEWLGIAIALAWLLHYVLFALLRRVAKAADSTIQPLVLARLYQPMRYYILASTIALVGESDALVGQVWQNIGRFIVPALAGWLGYALVRILALVLDHQVALDQDVMSQRRRHTRITLLSRVAALLVVMITASLMMLEIPGVRQLGATLIASAGLVGLAFGAAAQPALKSLIAGVQIALTEPIRIDDVVLVDGENGRVEDIRLSYVVICNGDERRIIIPTTKFLDTSFQNWTRKPGIGGSVILPIRPGVEIAPIRAAFTTLLAQQSAWDKRKGALQVSDVKAGVVELKLSLSAQTPSDLGILRLAVREAMLEWLRREMPDALVMEG